MLEEDKKKRDETSAGKRKGGSYGGENDDHVLTAKANYEELLNAVKQDMKRRHYRSRVAPTVERMMIVCLLQKLNMRS